MSDDDPFTWLGAEALRRRVDTVSEAVGHLAGAGHQMNAQLEELREQLAQLTKAVERLEGARHGSK